MKKISTFLKFRFNLRKKCSLISRLILIILFVAKIQSIDDLKRIYIGNDNYYIIDEKEINFYQNKGTTNNMILMYTFSNAQKIKDVTELENIGYGKFNCNPEVRNLILVKNYIYYVLDDDYYCNEELSKINGKALQLIAFECVGLFSYYYIVFIDNNKNLNLHYYKKLSGSCLLSKKSEIYESLIFNEIGSENFSCEKMDSSSKGEVLTCFYKSATENQIVATSFNINYVQMFSNKINELKTSSAQINGATIIKSQLSQDSKKAYVCFLNNNNDCDCLTYNIDTNQWTGIKTYLNNCLSTSLNSLNLDYFDTSNQFILSYSDSPDSYKVVRFDENLNIVNENTNNTYDLSEYLQQKCSNYYSSVLYNPEDINYLINCDNSFIVKADTEIQLAQITLVYNYTYSTFPISSTLITTIPSTLPNKLTYTTHLTYSTHLTYTTHLTYSTYTTIISTIISSSKFFNVNNNIYQEYTNKTKEEIIDNLDTFIEDYNFDNIYEIFGNDFNIKISPINSDIHSNISTYINFSNCYNILKKLNPSSKLTVFQIQIDNTYEKSLINNVEYAVFNDDKERLDLSVCKDEDIRINYELNMSLINMTKIRYYYDQGIDVFNIEDEFFNDICYSYSENESDMILKDRINDIYQNYSLCENNCEYEKINFTQNMVTCKCSLKTYIESTVEPPDLYVVIRDSFKDSNIAVLKCYKLVFSFKDKLQNIGFWIFTVLVFLHIPFIIYYCVYTIDPIKLYVYKEMEKFNYLIKTKNPKKKTEKKAYFNKINQKFKFVVGELGDNSSRTGIFKLKNIRQAKDKYKKNNISSMSSKSLKNLSKQKSLKNKEKNDKNKKNDKKKDKNKKSDKKNDKNNKKFKSPIVYLNYKILNQNYINMNNNERVSTINKIKMKDKNFKNEKIKQNKITKIIQNNYSLIRMDANNSFNVEYSGSNFILDNYIYETAIINDKRKFCDIFYVSILGKENIINIIFFRTPLDLYSLRMCNFIFTYSCDLAFNTIFYSNENISEKYHYEGDNLFLFTLINNLVQSITSSIVGLIFVNIFQHMIDYRGNFEDIFKKEEKKLRKNKDYKVSRKKKIQIFNKVRKIFANLKIKIGFFIVLEFLIMLFFYYFVTAFCEVYKQTQLSWLQDFFSSFLISIGCVLVESFIIGVLYILSIKYKQKIIYNTAIFFYNL